MTWGELRRLQVVLDVDVPGAAIAHIDLHLPTRGKFDERTQGLPVGGADEPRIALHEGPQYWIKGRQHGRIISGESRLVYLPSAAAAATTTAVAIAIAIAPVSTAIVLRTIAAACLV